MKFHLLLFFLITLLPWPARSEVEIGPAKIQFATPEVARRILTTRDDFIQRLSPFDRAARMKVARAVSEKAFLAFIAENVVAWPDQERLLVQQTLEDLRPVLGELQFPLPAAIQMIHTTGAEEGNAAYTRGTAIVLNKTQLAGDGADLKRLLCHELFHILSRQNAELREKLYEAIGFAKCNEIELPADLQRRKITNPDAPRNDHFIRLEVEGQKCLAVPVLLSRSETYDEQRGGEFFDYLQFQFLLVEKEGGSMKPVREGPSVKLVGPQDVTGFMEQVGRNTKYIIHPEEILAENFALLMLGERDVPNPEILARLEAILRPPARSR